MTRKAFTVQEANDLIPTLEAALARIAAAAETARLHNEKLQVLDALWGDRVLESENPDFGEWHTHRTALAEAVDTMEREIAAEISGRGIRFPAGGLQHGLLDFPTTWEGRWVYLCWRRDEPRVLAWHEIADGYAGRQPVLPEHERAMGRGGDADLPDDGVLDF